MTEESIEGGEMNHTPGPWIVGEENDVYLEGQAACIAMVVGGPDGIQESIANAKLIAAAPDLLEACQKALVCVQNGDCAEAGWYLDNVLAKATQ